MQKVTIIVEQASDGSYWCRTAEDIAGIGLNSCGDTVELLSGGKRGFRGTRQKHASR